MGHITDNAPETTGTNHAISSRQSTDATNAVPAHDAAMPTPANPSPTPTTTTLNAFAAPTPVNPFAMPNPTVDTFAGLLYLMPLEELSSKEQDVLLFSGAGGMFRGDDPFDDSFLDALLLYGASQNGEHTERVQLPALVLG
jgi:hypothetical protein